MTTSRTSSRILMTEFENSDKPVLWSVLSLYTGTQKEERREDKVRTRRHDRSHKLNVTQCSPQRHEALLTFLLTGRLKMKMWPPTPPTQPPAGTEVF